MTASEFAFLALGLVLGVVSGAALIEVLRSRPAARREVRLTVTPDSVPRRRSSTLSEDAFTPHGLAPAHGGPAEAPRTSVTPSVASSGRTAVHPSLRAAGAGDAASSLRLARLMAYGGPASGPPGAAVAIPIHREADWSLQSLRAVAASLAVRTPRASHGAAGAAAERPRDDGTVAGTPTASGGAATLGRSTVDDECREPARVAEERCAVAARAREHAAAAREALVSARRAYDDHQARAEDARSAADPRAIRSAKDEAQHAFRRARETATTREAIEAAARDWLTEINRVNHAAREATILGGRERDAANALVTTIERLTVEADAARISSEAAAEACLAAREALADCQERSAIARNADDAAGGRDTGGGRARAGRSDPWDAEASELEGALTATGAGEPSVLRLLRGDRDTLVRLVAELGGDDPDERRRWQLVLAGLVDAIVARAIEAAALTFPTDHPFWGGFSLAQNREIVAALSSLGFRFDGLGGWADGRTPTQRDLSLAVGYAGLDPMRIRRWPADEETAALFTDVAVAADEYLADAAGGLTLGELVSLLGPRADALADVWNEWGRVRPLLLAGG